MANLSKSKQVSKLSELKQLSDLRELAFFFDYEPKKFSYVLYKMEDDEKYDKFEISKKSGGERIIHAPRIPLLLIQKKLAQTLSQCVEEHKEECKKNNCHFWPASHGFQKGRTIISNGHVHRRRRFVFNLDLEDFFGTINFGRVRGFFIHDKVFALHPSVATVIAAIACHDNKLPQGSPCSPIISNLIGNILDSRLGALARNTQCTYTRYADDLTFSINKKIFPPEIATETEDGKWEVGKKLRDTIKETGFTINPKKTRMSLRQSRQTVTGLVVNKKANIRQEYYRNARAMCNSLFGSGFYYKPCDEDKTPETKLYHLEGILSHIYFVKGRRDRKSEINKELEETGDFYPPQGTETLYKKFLFYKHFVISPAPLVITEGSTDIVYLKCAIRMLAEQFPALARKQDSDLGQGVKFLRASNTIKDILNLVVGVGGQVSLIKDYEENLKRYNRSSKIEHPVIILCDNDNGGDKVFKMIKKKTGIEIDRESKEAFYELFENLYLIKVPKGEDKSREGVMEDLFSKRLLNTKWNDKSFNYKTNPEKDTQYGKEIFARYIVLKQSKQKDFAGFEPLLERIQAVIDHHNAPKPPPTTP